MRGAVRGEAVKQHSGKVVLPSLIINGQTAKTVLRLSDTLYYQVGPHGDYVQGY